MGVAGAALKTLGLFSPDKYRGTEVNNDTTDNIISMKKHEQAAVLSKVINTRSNALKRKEQIETKLEQLKIQIKNCALKGRNPSSVIPINRLPLSTSNTNKRSTIDSNSCKLHFIAKTKHQNHVPTIDKRGRRSNINVAEEFLSEDIDLKESMSCPAIHNMSLNIKSEMVQDRIFDHSVQRTRREVASRRKRHKKNGVLSIDKLSSEETVIQRGWLSSAFKKISVIAAGSVSTSQSFILESDMVAEDVDFQDFESSL